MIAPVNKDAKSETASGFIMMGVLAIGMGVVGLFQPFWQPTIRLHLPIGLLSIVALPVGIWFILGAVNVFRHARQG